MPVYIIQADDGPVKIGAAEVPRKRLNTLQSGHHQNLRIIRLFDAPRGFEDILHRHYARLWIRGEWFRFSPCMLTQAFAPDLPVPERQYVRTFEQIRRLRLGAEATRMRDLLRSEAARAAREAA